MVEDFLKETVRAEDIILGSLGLGEDAKILSIEKRGEGYKGIAKWSDGEQFPFDSDGPLDELESWALTILLKRDKAS